ncbi:prolipoprotein diacylglyceryl transferase [Frankia sp. CNm7]|uniref:Phosphatidylglycerol--prolipoprotein diacylglyceryl transferase n=1 Tax=Frankia nepalensis TaxID=1836974 RepID=A0A937RR15_9ACTN|nr:prolipoprotein diacylglyceryl transferase [Frankia nepalensis]MBL7500576.1 prolipoprotein diacylglyceryl transferase [Frankia nepalensis]MBL7509561.1 prolipoprotein diacylglyceryl transferase [Frankia nepalensis]MBL7524389.1 prolipoprotein diacylglyceryl transferase [Frankia nepalensis]MBL7633400.1 prolipoprotein diacylglyceryl transferase [Frankia nepalensis]
MVLAAIPSPSQGVIHLGPLPLRAYAFMIIIGVVVAVWLTGRRLSARGADPSLAGDAGVWAVLFGIVGARLYHVVSSPDAYFGADGNLADTLKIWNGGLAIWGAVAGGALGVWIACRRAKASFLLFADAAAPGLVLAQAIGRWGNWFNQELFGRPSTLPWALEIDAEHRPAEYLDYATFHPTFLYESLWCLGIAAVLLVVDRRRRLGRGRLLLLYIMLYTAGRAWIEALRIDDAEHIAGLRLNDWVSAVVFVAALVTFLLLRKPVDAPAKPAAAAVPSASSAAGDAASSPAGAPAKDASAKEAPAAEAAASDLAKDPAKDQATPAGTTPTDPPKPTDPSKDTADPSKDTAADATTKLKKDGDAPAAVAGGPATAPADPEATVVAAGAVSGRVGLDKPGTAGATRGGDDPAGGTRRDA